MRKVRDLIAYYRANTPWLDRQTVTSIDPIINGLACASWEAVRRWAFGSGQMDLYWEMAEAAKGYEAAGSPEIDAELMEKIREMLAEPLDDPKVKELVTERLEPLAEALAVMSACCSPEWVEGAFCELRMCGVLRSSPPEVAIRHTKIVHMADAPSTSCLLP